MGSKATSGAIRNATDRDAVSNYDAFEEFEARMAGMKRKLAHQRADSSHWIATPQAQRRHLLNLLQQVVDDLEHEALSDPPMEGADPSNAPPSRNEKSARQARPVPRRAAAR